MSDNLPTNVRLDANGKGTVTFATDVVATIAGLAALRSAEDVAKIREISVEQVKG
jgi:ribosomal protein S5